MGRRFLVSALLVLALFPATAFATHWSGVKWNKPAPMTITVYDSTTNPRWTNALAAAVAQWNVSSVVDFVIVPYSNGCAKKSGAIVACEYQLGVYPYGPYGLTEITTKGQGNISTVVIKLNNDPDWAYWAWDGAEDAGYHPRQQVTCHELGHALGLAHRPYPEESCMDQNLPDVYWPDAHDFAELSQIYD